MPQNPANPPRRPKSPAPSNSESRNIAASSAAGLAALDRLLPEAREAERALLGSMLLSKEAIGEARMVLRSAGKEVFAREAHQILYEILTAFYLTDRPVDSVTLKEELKARGVWDAVGGLETIAGLVTAVPSATRVRHYAEIVQEKHLLRQLIGAVHEVLERAFDDRCAIKETLDFAEKTIFAVTEKRVSGEAQPLVDLLTEAARLLDQRGEDRLTGVPTGYFELDEITCGLQPGELIIVAGRPSMGKTAFGLNMAENMSIAEELPVLFFSLEMSKQQVAQRILCSRARIDNHRLRRGRISDAEVAALHNVLDQCSHAPLLVDDTSDLTILELRARARLAQRRLVDKGKRLHAIFVDYLQLMHVPQTESRQQEVATISRGLKALAKDLGLPVVAMAQLNRNPEDKLRKGNRPRMSDLRESGAIEQDADVVMLLHREAYYKVGAAPAAVGAEKPENGHYTGGGEAPLDDSTAEVIIAKQRNGPVGTVTLHFNRQWTRFDNHDPMRRDSGFVPHQKAAAPF